MPQVAYLGPYQTAATQTMRAATAQPLATDYQESMDSSVDARWAPKRQPSRRRKVPPKENLQVSQNREERDPKGTFKPGRSRCSGIIIYPLVVCLLIILAYLYQSNVPDPLRFLIPSRIVPGSLIFRGSDSVRPRIQLHPEAHAYRQPVTQHLEWLVTSDYLRPDGVLKRVYLVNGSSSSSYGLIL